MLSAGSGVIAITGLSVYSTVGIAVAVTLRDDTALMSVRFLPIKFSAITTLKMMTARTTS